MKKVICILIAGLFALSFAQAQPPEKLTNTSIIKMTRANLADDIIIDEITTSAVNFNLCADSVNVLIKARVSQQVIQAMKLASGSQTATQEAIPALTPVLTPVSSVPIVNPIPASK